MKKFVYLCAMMLLSMNIMAQIDPHDRNWKVVVFDDFDDTTLQFDNTFQQPDNGQWRWIAFSSRSDPSGVTKWNTNNVKLTVIMQECPDNTVNYEPITKKEEP